MQQEWTYFDQLEKNSVKYINQVGKLWPSAVNTMLTLTADGMKQIFMLIVHYAIKYNGYDCRGLPYGLKYFDQSNKIGVRETSAGQLPVNLQTIIIYSIFGDVPV